jgi:phosphoglycolate phosphatase-like HAD superfamily hydrolase
LAAKTIPSEGKQDILRQLEHDDRPSPAEIKQQIVAAQDQVREQKDQDRKAQRRAKTWAKMTPGERTKFEKREQRRERQERQRLQELEEKERQRMAEAENLLDVLIERLGTEVSEVLTRIQEVGVYALLARYPERTKVAPPGEELSAVDS